MRTFWVLVRKELSELITLQILAPFIAVIVIFVALGGVINEAGSDTAATRVSVADLDGSEYSQLVVESLESAGLDVALAEDGGVDDETGAGLFVEIPAGFQEGIESGDAAPVRVRTIMKSFSFVGMAGGGELQQALGMASQSIAARLAAEKAPSVSLDQLQQPFPVEESVTVGDKTAAASVAQVSSFISQQTVFIPIVLFIVIMFASQLIATTIATEKENKTLETLLSYPIGRASLVTAKMFAAGLISLLAAAAYMFGMQQYMSGIDASMSDASSILPQASRAVMEQLGLVLGPSDYVMLGLSLFAGILLALSIALILGAFAESVKAVGALITPLTVLLMVPYLLSMFVDIASAAPALKWALLAIPFTHPFMAAQNLFLGNEMMVWAGIGYQALWFAMFAVVAARIFSSDRILTMKLDLRRKR